MDALMNAALVGLILFVLLWVVVPRIRMRNSPPALESERKTPLELDSPLFNSAQDQLNRYSVAGELASTIASQDKSQSLVVSLEGPWGEGKTTILNWTKDILSRNAPHPILIDFDPWPDDSTRGTAARLLDAVANAIASSSEVPQATRLSITELLSRIADAAAKERPASYGALRQLLSWLMYPDRRGSALRPHPDLAADRIRLKDAVSTLGSRLVIFVDDLDRTDAEQLRAIFQAVHALSSFPNTTVVLAFDPEIADNLLQSTGLGSVGPKFREKIVNLSLKLPLPRSVDRQRCFETSLRHNLNAIGAADIWDSWHGDHVEQAVIKAVELSGSPRSLKRLALHTAIVVHRLGADVNSGDVLMLEMLRAEFPAVWHSIALNKGSIRQRSLMDLVPTGSAKALPTPLELALEPLKGQSTEAKVREALEFLFPQYSEYRSRLSSDRSDAAQSRVSLERNLSKYFHFGVARDDVRDADARRLIADPSCRAELIAHCLGAGNMDALFAVAAQQIDQEKEQIPETERFCLSILEASAEAWQRNRVDATDEAMSLLHRICRTKHSDSDVSALLGAIATSTRGISASEALVVELLKQGKLWPPNDKPHSDSPSPTISRDQLVSAEELNSLRSRWVEAAWATGLSRIFKEEPRPMSIVFRLGQLATPSGADYSRVQAELERFLEDPKNLLSFVSAFSGKVRGVNFSVDGTEKLVQDYDELLVRIVKLSQPDDAIAKFREVYEARRGSQNQQATDDTPARAGC